MTDRPDMTLTLPVDERTFWVLVFLAGLAGLSYLIVRTLEFRVRSGKVATGWQMQALAGFAAVLAPLWLALIGVVIAALWRIAWSFPDLNPEDATQLRWHVLALVGLLTALGGLVGTPLALMRLYLTDKQTSTAEQSLFNDKINTASDDLHAMRQRWDGAQNIWEPDIVRRNAAIDRLEGLAKEQPSEVPRIVRMLSVYDRELSKEVPPEPAPADASPAELKDWARQLTVKRSDMQTAVQALGRLRKSFDGAFDPKTIDLTGANLQGMLLSHDDFNFRGILLAEASMQGANLAVAQLQGAHLGGAELQGANLAVAQLQRAYLRDAELQGANLYGAQLQGAYLRGVELQRANLWGAELQGANLRRAQLQGANLRRAQLQGASLWDAQLQGADLRGAQFDTSTALDDATLRGAAVREVDFNNLPQITPHIHEVFGDATVILPGGVTPDHPDWPSHFAKDELDYNGFQTAWRAFQKSIGFDRDDPSTWNAPK